MNLRPVYVSFNDGPEQHLCTVTTDGLKYLFEATIPPHLVAETFTLHCEGKVIYSGVIHNPDFVDGGLFRMLGTLKYISMKPTLTIDEKVELDDLDTSISLDIEYTLKES